MESFLASLKKESQEYTKTAIAIDEIQREFTVRFEELEDQANLKVKNLRRPMTVMQKSQFAKEVKVKPRNVKSELARANMKNRRRTPNTARNFSRGNNFDIDYRRRPQKTNQNPKMWVTDDVPISTANNVDPNSTFTKANYPNIYFSNTDNYDDYDNHQLNPKRRKVLNDPFQISSHHFTCDRFDEPKTARRPKTSQKWTSPVCVRKIERKLTDDERIWDDEPEVEKMVF